MMYLYLRDRVLFPDLLFLVCEYGVFIVYSFLCSVLLVNDIPCWILKRGKRDQPPRGYPGKLSIERLMMNQ